MGKNEIDIAVIKNEVENLQHNMQEGFNRMEKSLAEHVHNIMSAIETKADKQQTEKDIGIIKKDYNKIIFMFISLLVSGLFAFIYKTIFP